jgi:hypothetical protein
LRACIHRDECACIVSVSDVLCNSQKKLTIAGSKHIIMSPRRLSNKDWRVVEEIFQKKLSSWKGKLFSSGGRLVLINSVLSSLPMSLMSFLRIPKNVLEKLDYYRSRFFWKCDEHKKKYWLAKWSIFINLRVCVCVGGGWGMGIIDLDIQINSC